MNAPVFSIGGKETKLPPISFDMVERSIEQIGSTNPEMTNISYRAALLAVLAVFLDVSLTHLKQSITYAESAAVMERWAEVMLWAGLIAAAPGEVAAASLLPSASET